MELSQPPGAGAAIDAKRERKRSRYLSPPYTDSEVKVVDDDGGKEEPPPDVCAADVLSALGAAALLSLDTKSSQQALRFLTLYRRKTLGNPAAAAAGVDHNKRLLNLRTGTGPAPAPAPASAVSKKPNLPTAPAPAPGSKKQQPPPAPAIRKGNLDEAAGHKRGSDAASANDKSKNKKMKRQEHFGNAASPPVPKLPLKDVRNNLEKMILSLTSRTSLFKAGLPEEGGGKPAMGNLVGEMQGLLAKVDKMLQGGASSTVHHN